MKSEARGGDAGLDGGWDLGFRMEAEALGGRKAQMGHGGNGCRDLDGSWGIGWKKRLGGRLGVRRGRMDWDGR